MNVIFASDKMIPPLRKIQREWSRYFSIVLQKLC